VPHPQVRPITNREYYQVFAIFNQTADANRADEAPTTPPPHPIKRPDRGTERPDRGRAGTPEDRQVVAELPAWEAEATAHPTSGHIASDAVTSSAGATLDVQPDDQSGIRIRSRRTPTLSLPHDLSKITGVSHRSAPDPSLPNGDPAGPTTAGSC